MPPEPTPAGTLYVVATPIGNLSDLSARAREILAAADIVACEDTRTTRPLLAAHGIEARTIAIHEHNERLARDKVVGALLEGKSVALVSDAGTPAVSDPGALVVEAAHRAGVRVIPIPGSNAAMTAFSAAGFLTDRFLFAGFLPASGSSRRKALAALDVACPVIFYEAPHRILETVEDLLAAFGAERELVIAREVTKKFEEIARMPLSAAKDWVLSGAHRQQGEFVLVLGPRVAAESEDDGEADRILTVLLEDHSVSDAARITARLTGGSKNELYARALAIGVPAAAGKPRRPR